MLPRRKPDTAEPGEHHQLVAAIAQGDPDAVSALHDRFSARVYFVALRDLRSPSDAEDVRTETFIRVLEAIRAGRLASPEALASFVLSTARNVIREFGRQGRRAEPIEDRDFTATGREPHAEHALHQAMEWVIRRLKPRERTFLRLYYYEELSRAEISRQLGVPEERLRLVKSRALKSFREIYQRLAK